MRPPTFVQTTILVVEDDVDLRTALLIAFDEEGFAVESAGDGLDALRKVQQATPDLVILDLNMPLIGGEDFLYAWRTGVETTGVPVIVITADPRALGPEDLGVAAVFAKPFDIDELLSSVRGLLVDPAQARAAAGRDPRGKELAEIANNLASMMNGLLIGVARLAQAPALPDDLRTIAIMDLEAARHASVLVRRLNQLIKAGEQ